jgi:hypothetical protein
MQKVPCESVEGIDDLGGVSQRDPKIADKGADESQRYTTACTLEGRCERVRLSRARPGDDQLLPRGARARPGFARRRLSWRSDEGSQCGERRASGPPRRRYC